MCVFFNFSDLSRDSEVSHWFISLDYVYEYDRMKRLLLQTPDKVGWLVSVWCWACWLDLCFVLCVHAYVHADTNPCRIWYILFISLCTLTICFIMCLYNQRAPSFFSQLPCFPHFMFVMVGICVRRGQIWCGCLVMMWALNGICSVTCLQLYMARIYIYDLIYITWICLHLASGWSFRPGQGVAIMMMLSLPNHG